MPEIDQIGPEERKEVQAPVQELVRLFEDNGYKVIPEQTKNVARAENEIILVNNKGQLATISPFDTGDIDLIIGKTSRVDGFGLFDESESESKTPEEVMALSDKFHLSDKFSALSRGAVFSVEMGKGDNSLVARFRKGLNKVIDAFYG
ncbi:hypothetical protein KKA95_02320 [Patescibacteria group bacterium]|nr:hypothetical protein [Patescibacteria group bacterium]